MTEIASPSGFKDPESLLTVPVCASSVNAAADFKSGGIQLENIQAAEQFTVGVEELVVVDLRVLTKDPLPARLVVRLCRAALDLVAQGVLALIGEGQVRIVQNHQTGPEKNAGQQQWQRDAVQAEAAGLEGDEFVVLCHHSESDQHGYESGERRELVEQVAGK